MMYSYLTRTQMPGPPICPIDDASSGTQQTYTCFSIEEYTVVEALPHYLTLGVEWGKTA
jgi:hypothetical protein